MPALVSCATPTVTHQVDIVATGAGNASVAFHRQASAPRPQGRACGPCRVRGFAVGDARVKPCVWVAVERPGPPAVAPDCVYIACATAVAGSERE